MRAFLLAAGLGTRLRPLTDHVPKPLVPVGGEPLVERAVRQLGQAGVSEIGINLFHLGAKIQHYLGTGQRYGVDITYFDEQPKILGTGGGLKRAESFLRAGGDAFILVNGDVWHDFDLGALRGAHAPDALATMAVHRTTRRPELHTVRCHAETQCIEAVAPPPVDNPREHFAAIYTGVAVYATRLLDWLPAGKEAGLVSHGILPAIEAGERVMWTEPTGAWFDCGTHAELLRASLYALGLRRSLRDLSSHLG